MTSLSIHTNTGAQAALATLGRVNSTLQTVQNQLSTGLKVSGAKDNASVFAVAQGVRANLAALDAINTSLGNAQSALSVAIAGATTVSNTVSAITQTLGHLADGTINHQQRQTYTVQLFNEVTEVGNVLVGSSYNGSNLVSSLDGGDTLPSNLIVSSGLGGQQLTIPSQNLYGPGGGNPNADQSGFLSLARLVYYVTDPSGGDDDSPFDTTYDSESNAIINYHTLGVSSGSRSEINQQEALAALSPIGAKADYVSPGVYSNGVFSGAVQRFQANVSSALRGLSVSYKDVESQITFVQGLSDTGNTALGNLVDANLAKSAAVLTATQTQQSLAIQSLSISNSQPQNILALFQRAA